MKEMSWKIRKIVLESPGFSNIFFSGNPASSGPRSSHLCPQMEKESTSKVVKSFLSLPNGNASVERSLSDNKNKLINKRINLKEETLMALGRAKEYARDRGGTHNVDTYRKG